VTDSGRWSQAEVEEVPLLAPLALEIRVTKTFTPLSGYIFTSQDR
jgi:hypothetical protein